MNTFPPFLDGTVTDIYRDSAEKAHILRVLRSVKWNKKQAAEILGIGRPTIYDKMKQFGIREGD